MLSSRQKSVMVSDDFNKQKSVHYKFRRGIRRLMIMRQFARNQGLLFDIENLDLAHYTKRRRKRNALEVDNQEKQAKEKEKKQNKKINELSDIEKELIEKRKYITAMIDYLNLNSFMANEELQKV